jgi:hypothetical protein
MANESQVAARNRSAYRAEKKSDPDSKLSDGTGANRLLTHLFCGHGWPWKNSERETDMSVKGEIKEGAGFVKEEMNEHGKSPESQRKAQEGRDLRNEGRVEDGKAPKTTKPGTGHPEK